MKKFKAVFRTPITYIMAILAAMRILVAHLLGVWFPAGQIWDDSLLMEYAGFSGHFNSPNRSSLLKTMGYPLFLKIVSVSKLPYTIVLGIIWVVAALFVYFLVKRMEEGKRGLALASYIYILFLPQAFDFWSGTRLYRTGMIAPFVIVTFVMMLHVILDVKDESKKLLIHSIILGLCFAYTYYIKEDGLWLMACLAFVCVFSVVVLTVKCKKNWKQLTGRVLLVLVPVFVWGLATISYKAVNMKFFGVFDINTRTESEYGSFMENVYRVDSDDRSLLLWAPYDAIDQVFAASKTLSEYPELLEAVHDSVWAEDLSVGHEIPGDHFAFALREEMYNLGMFESEAAFKAFFRQVNSEVEEAFKDGRLKKADRIQLLASTGGYTKEEVKSLSSLVIDSFKGAILLKGYKLGLGEVSDWEIENLAATVSFAKSITHISYLDGYAGVSEKSGKCARVLQPLLMVYKSINVILFISLFITLLFEIVRFFINIKSIKTFSKNRCKIVLEAFAAFVLLGVSVCYAFSISWFSAFCFVNGVNMTILNFYNIALPGLLALAYIFTILMIKDEIVLMRDSKKGELQHV